MSYFFDYLLEFSGIREFWQVKMTKVCPLNILGEEDIKKNKKGFLTKACLAKI